MDNVSLEKIPFNNYRSPYISDINLNLMQNNIETAINVLRGLVETSTGLGTNTTPQIREQNINDIQTSGFVYLNGCNYDGTAIENGYLLTIAINSNYVVQFYTIYSNSDVLRYRKKVNGVWSAFKDILTENSSIVKVVETSITIPVTAAGGHGYVSRSITIPNGYKSIATEFQTGAIALNSGLQLTAMNKASQTTGTADLYVQYYNPTAITEAQSITVYIICLKSSFIS